MRSICSRFTPLLSVFFSDRWTSFCACVGGRENGVGGRDDEGEGEGEDDGERVIKGEERRRGGRIKK